MKKIEFTRIVALVAVVLMLLTLCACGGNNSVGGTESESKTETETETETEIFFDYMGSTLSDYLNVADYKNTEIKYTETVVSRQEAIDYTEEMLTYYGIYNEETGRPTETGDIICMDYKGLLDGEEFSGGTAKDQFIQLAGTGGYIEGFAAGLVGVTPGQTVTLDLKFPEDYKEELAGRDVVFEVTVNYIQDYTMTDEIAKEYFPNVADTAEAFLDKVQKDLYDQIHGEDAMKQIAWDTILENSTVISLPEEAVKYYYDNYVEYYKEAAENNKCTYEEYLEDESITDEMLRNNANECVKNDIVFYTIIKNEELSVTDEEYTEYLKEIADTNGTTSENIEKYYGKEYIKQSMLYEEVLDIIYKSNTFVKDTSKTETGE